jgi:hypothetical protein
MSSEPKPYEAPSVEEIADGSGLPISVTPGFVGST